MASLDRLAAVVLVALARAAAADVPPPRDFDVNQAFAPARAASESGDGRRAFDQASEILVQVERRCGPADPRTMQAIGKHAYFARRAGRSDAVERDLKRLLGAGPSDCAAPVEAAHLLRELGRPREALTAAARAVARCPADAGALDEEGEALLALGRVDDASAAISSAVALSPYSAWMRVRLAQIYRMQGRWDESARLDEQARRRGAGRAVSIDEGYARLYAGKPDEAIDEFAALAASSPTDPVLIHHWAQALWVQGRYSEAVEKFERARRLFVSQGRRDTDYFHTLHHLATLYASADRPNDALAIALQALSELPADAAPAWRAEFPGLVLALHGPLDKAERAAEEGLRLCRAQNCSVADEVELKLVLARAAAQTGRRGAATRYVDASVESLDRWRPLNDGDCAARVQQLVEAARLLEAQGRSRKARRALDSAGASWSCVSFNETLDLRTLSAGVRCRAGDVRGAVDDLRAARAAAAPRDAARVAEIDDEQARMKSGEPERCPPRPEGYP